MRRTVLTLAAFLLLIGYAWASAIDDAQICYEGTQQPAPEYVPYCTRAIEARNLNTRDLAMTHNNRGAILQMLGREDEALADFNRALTLNPALSLSYLNRGMIFANRQEFRRAWDDFNRAIEVAPDDSRGYVNRSLVYFKTEQFDYALKDLEQALLVNPEDPLAYNNRAVIFYREGKPDLAFEDSERAIMFGIDAFIKRGLAEPGLYKLRVDINYSRGNYEESLAEIDRVIRMRGDTAGAHNQRAWILATCPEPNFRDGEEAIRSARIAVRLADGPEYRDTLAAAFAEAGQFEKAIAEQEIAISMLRQAGQSTDLGRYQQVLDGYRKGQPRRITASKG
jgi:tetratricopeptide (TPR) repeat protein